MILLNNRRLEHSDEYSLSQKICAKKKLESLRFSQLFGWTRATIGDGDKCYGYLNKHNNKIRFPLFSNWQLNSIQVS